VTAASAVVATIGELVSVINKIALINAVVELHQFLVKTENRSVL